MSVDPRSTLATATVADSENQLESQAYLREETNPDQCKFIAMSEEHLFQLVLDEHKDYQFEKEKEIDTECAEQASLYAIDYMKRKFNSLESLTEGQFVLAKRLQVTRKTVNSKTNPDPSMYEFVTELVDLQHAGQYKASIGIVHGLAQCSHTFFEIGF